METSIGQKQKGKEERFELFGLSGIKYNILEVCQ